MTAGAANVTEPRVLPRTLAGSTVLQVVTALRNAPKARAAVDVAHALVQVGARAIVAGERGELIEELESFGGEWLPFMATAFNLRRRRADATTLGRLSAAERVDIIHARTAGAARIAKIAIDGNGIHLVTELPDLSAVRMRLAVFSLAALGRGDRVISHSMFNARPMIARHRIPPERVSVIPPSLDLAHFDPASVPPDRVTQLRQAWDFPHGTRIAVVPGAIAPRSGHLVLVEAARILAGDGMQGVTFVLVGDDQHHRRFARKFWKRARAGRRCAVSDRRASCRYGRGLCRGRPGRGALHRSAARWTPGRGGASHDAAGDRIVGWCVVRESFGAAAHRGGFAHRLGGSARQRGGLAGAIAAALALDADAQHAYAARARQFAEYMFSPQRATAATLEVYASLLDSDG